MSRRRRIDRYRWPTCASISRAIELVEVPHAVFHRRLVGPDFAAALRDQRAAAGVHPLGDLVVLLRGLAIRRLFGFDELALEQRDLFGIVELDDVERACRRPRGMSVLTTSTCGYHSTIMFG